MKEYFKFITNGKHHVLKFRFLVMTPFFYLTISFIKMDLFWFIDAYKWWFESTDHRFGFLLINGGSIFFSWLISSAVRDSLK